MTAQENRAPKGMVLATSLPDWGEKTVLKYMHKQHADSLLSGNLRFSAASSYWEMEYPIGDPRELRSSVHIASYSPRAQDGLSPFGPQVRGNFTMTNVTFEHECDDALVSCFTLGSFEETSAGLLNREPFHYDACIEITDLHELLCIASRSGVLDPGGTGTDAIGGIHAAPVEYMEIDKKNVTQAGWIPPSPFRKSIKYGWQKEIRVIMPKYCEEAFLRVPEAAHLFRRVV
ncbi:hypothetical protein [Mesorhizobium sp. WSM2239]|uniref:Uncharacterized protein n=2 Tax=unclassified Mesorhizobium TaxID=325217 RepID=A0AAU8D1J6_9HYPH